MTYYVRKLHYVTQSIIPVGWLVMTAWYTVQEGKDIESVLLVGVIAVAFTAFFLYGFIRQTRTPLVVTDKEGIRIQNVWRAAENTAWDLVSGVKKYPILGYKLETLGRGLWLPLGMLTNDDAKKLLQEVQERVNGKS